MPFKENNKVKEDDKYGFVTVTQDYRLSTF